MGSYTVTITMFDLTAERDAITGWDEGDVVYVRETHRLYVWEDDDAWHELARAEDLA